VDAALAAAFAVDPAARPPLADFARTLDTALAELPEPASSVAPARGSGGSGTLPLGPRPEPTRGPDPAPGPRPGPAPPGNRSPPTRGRGLRPGLALLASTLGVAALAAVAADRRAPPTDAAPDPAPAALRAVPGRPERASEEGSAPPGAHRVEATTSAPETADDDATTPTRSPGDAHAPRARGEARPGAPPSAAAAEPPRPDDRPGSGPRTARPAERGEAESGGPGPHPVRGTSPGGRRPTDPGLDALRAALVALRRAPGEPGALARTAGLLRAAARDRTRGERRRQVEEIIATSVAVSDPAGLEVALELIERPGSP
jgi:hypothetical protein